jgi:hypothetical protein
VLLLQFCFSIAAGAVFSFDAFQHVLFRYPILYICKGFLQSLVLLLTEAVLLPELRQLSFHLNDQLFLFLAFFVQLSYSLLQLANSTDQLLFLLF